MKCIITTVKVVAKWKKKLEKKTRNETRECINNNKYNNYYNLKIIFGASKIVLCGGLQIVMWWVFICMVYTCIVFVIFFFFFLFCFRGVINNRATGAGIAVDVHTTIFFISSTFFSFFAGAADTVSCTGRQQTLLFLLRLLVGVIRSQKKLVKKMKRKEKTIYFNTLDSPMHHV